MQTMRALLLLSLLCTSYTAPYTPSPDRPFEEIPEFRGQGSIALVNMQSDEERRAVESSWMLANYREWTDVAIEIAARELRLRGLTIDPAAERQIRLAVTEARVTTGWVTIASELDMTVETGDGATATYTAENSSAMAANLQRQIDGALMRAVVAMLKDPRVVDYLKN